MVPAQPPRQGGHSSGYRASTAYTRLLLSALSLRRGAVRRAPIKHATRSA